MADLNIVLLDSFVGKSINDICPLKFGSVGDAHNHCAHFVGYVLKLNNTVGTGLTLAGMVWKGNPTASSLIRVNDIYNMCKALAEPCSIGCLAYYTVPDNIEKGGRMGSMSKKHIGICFQGFVYNYGNTLDAVRKDKVGDLAALYGKTTITLYTALPTGYTVLTLPEILGLAKK